MCARTRRQRGGGTTAPKGGGLGKQRGHNLLWEPWEGLGRLLPAPLGLPKGFLEVQVRREADPGECGGIPRTAGALDPSLHLQETQFLPLTWKNRDLMELGTNSDSAGCSKGIPATHTHNPGKAPAKSRRCRARFGAPGNGSASCTARGGRALGTRLDGGWQHSLLPPDPL